MTATASSPLSRTECVDNVKDAFAQMRDGVRIHYRDCQPRQTAPGAAPVLCLHGLTRNLSDFDDLAPQIAALGRRVISATQRGRGRSDFDPKPDNYVVETYTADMLELLDQLGIDAAIVIGTSMGGLIGMALASAAPERVAGLVLNDVGPEIGEVGLNAIKGYVGDDPQVRDWAEAEAYSRKIAGAAFPNERDDAFWRRFASRIFIEDDEGRLRLDYDSAIAERINAGEAAPPDLWGLFASMRAKPVLLIRGALSRLLEPETAAAMRETHPGMAFAEVPNVGHAPTLTEPAAWAAIESFLQRQL